MSSDALIMLSFRRSSNIISGTSSPSCGMSHSIWSGWAFLSTNTRKPTAEDSILELPWKWRRYPVRRTTVMSYIVLWPFLNCFYSEWNNNTFMAKLYVGFNTYRLYSCLANGSADEFQKGDHLFKGKAVKEALQIGMYYGRTHQLLYGLFILTTMWPFMDDASGLENLNNSAI